CARERDGYYVGFAYW
nr:immunoglobulin heavy chain junction region [Mus musculus]